MDNAVAPKIATKTEPPRTFDWRTFDPSMLEGGMDATFAPELITYRDNLDAMVEDHSGQFVVIKGRDIIGFYPSPEAAAIDSFEKFGEDSVLIKQVSDRESVRSLGSIRPANS